MKLSTFSIVLIGGVVTAIALLQSQSATKDVDWPVYGGNPGSTRYSALQQINQSNVQRLQVAWSFDAGDGTGSLQTNPIVVNGVLFGYTLAQKVFAVDAATGKP